MSQFIPVCEPLLAGNELEYVADAVATGWISSSGSYVAAFEETFAEYCGARHAIAVCNGTVALHLALRALDVGPGDEVIIPNFTMIASALAICYCSAKPVFVDADAVTWNIDTAAIEQKINPATKGIMAVHIFGNPCDMATLQHIADRHGLWLMEDAAEAHGALFQGRRAGNLSRIAGFSFFANKNITTGEGGMVVTNDANLAHACRYFKNMCFPLDAPRAYRLQLPYEQPSCGHRLGPDRTRRCLQSSAPVAWTPLPPAPFRHPRNIAAAGHALRRIRQLDERLGTHA